MKTILYIGHKDNYYTQISNLLAQKELEEEINLVLIDKEIKNLSLLFQCCLSHMPDYLICDHELIGNTTRDLVTLCRNSNLLNIQLYFSVLPERSRMFIERVSLLGDIVYFYKTLEARDLAHCLQGLCAPEKTEPLKVARALYAIKFNIYEQVQIDYLTRKGASFLTNFKFQVNQSERMNLSLLPEVFHAHSHFIEEVEAREIPSHFRNRYQVKFEYYNIPARQKGLTNTLAKAKYEMRFVKIPPEFVSAVKAAEKASSILLVAQETPAEEIIDNNDALEKLKLMGETSYFNWFWQEVQNKTNTDPINLTIYDKKFKLLQNGDTKLVAQNIRIRYRHHVNDVATEIANDYPHVLAINFQDIANLDEIRQLLDEFVYFKNYFPYVIIFNSSLPAAQIRDELHYHFIVVAPIDINEDFLIKVSNLYRKKHEVALQKRAKRLLNKIEPAAIAAFEEFEEEMIIDHRLYLGLEHENSLFEQPMEVELISITENEVIFRSPEEIEIGRIFKMTNPITMQIVLVPHLPEQAEARIEKCYRGLIHLINEDDKQALRKYVNAVAQMNTKDRSSLTTEQIKELINQYFIEPDQ